MRRNTAQGEREGRDPRRRCGTGVGNKRPWRRHDAVPTEQVVYMLDVLVSALARLLSASSIVLRDVPTFIRMWLSEPLP